MPPVKRYCPKCQKTMAEIHFYSLRDGTKCELCKGCLTMHINNWQPDTYLWILEKMDVPYVPQEWNKILDAAYQKDPYKITGMSVIGKYLAKMKLNQFRPYHWADTEKLQQEYITGKEGAVGAEEAKERAESVLKAYENGEITEAQYETYKAIEAPDIKDFTEPPPMPPADGGKPTSNGGGSAYPVNDHPFVEVQLEDMSQYLTEEDKIYMAMKWGIYYTAEQWIKLEKLYKEFTESYTIDTAGTIDTLKQICKLSLKGNEALDSGDVDSYSKYSRAYDALMKSAKFTEAQNKEGKADTFDSIGSLVLFAEKEGGKIDKYKIEAPHDVIDTILQDNKTYIDNVVKNDPNIESLISQHIKKMEIIAEAKQRKAEELASGEEDNLTIADYDKYADAIIEQMEADREAEENDD